MEVRLLDYRELEKSGMEFDRVVSVGMIEHVERGNYERFMRNVDAVLTPGGFVFASLSVLLGRTRGMPGLENIFFQAVRYRVSGKLSISCRIIIFILWMWRALGGTITKHCSVGENFRKCKDKVAADKGEDFARMWELYLASRSDLSQWDH